MKIIAYLKGTFALNAQLLELWGYSFVTFALERFFLVLQQLSLLTCKDVMPDVVDSRE
jgi:hypothetical protein